MSQWSKDGSWFGRTFDAGHKRTLNAADGGRRESAPLARVAGLRPPSAALSEAANTVADSLDLTVRMVDLFLDSGHDMQPRHLRELRSVIASTRKLARSVADETVAQHRTLRLVK